LIINDKNLQIYFALARSSAVVPEYSIVSFFSFYDILRVQIGIFSECILIKFYLESRQILSSFAVEPFEVYFN